VLVNSEEIHPHHTYTWKKPILLLSDELSASCADQLAHLFKVNGIAKIFGQRTAGLGGEVEAVGVLPHSKIRVSLTRSLFKSGPGKAENPTETLVENNGVLPDYVYNPTIEDFRSGYINYVREFSERAIEQKK